MRREELITTQPLVAKISPQVPVDQIQIAKAPEVIPGHILFMQVAQCRFEITELVRAFRCKSETQTVRYPRAVIRKADMPLFNIRRQVIQRSTIAHQQPVNTWIAPAALDEKRHPEWPLTKVGNEKNDARRLIHY